MITTPIIAVTDNELQPPPPPPPELKDVPGVSGSDAFFIVRSSLLESVPSAFSAVIETLKVPADVGIPFITFPSQLKPSGSPETVHLMLPDPVAYRVALYDLPTVPSGRLDVCILAGLLAVELLAVEKSLIVAE